MLSGYNIGTAIWVAIAIWCIVAAIDWVFPTLFG